jgi:16S rRNA (cytidine1402-2'-O)-methyltransferase
MAHGSLYLVAAWLSEETPPAAVLPATVLERIHKLAHFVVEDAKSARAFLGACGHPKPMREIAMVVLDEHTAAKDVPAMLSPLLEGNDVGLLSEAGAPAVADPGTTLVREAHARGIRVVPLVGPSSILLALMASGLEGQRFRFVGYLPADSAARREAIANLERASARDRETQVFIETPYRNDALMADLLHACRPSTRLAVAVDLTSPSESVAMRPVAEWRRNVSPLGKRPAIFLLLA